MQAMVALQPDLLHTPSNIAANPAVGLNTTPETTGQDTSCDMCTLACGGGGGGFRPGHTRAQCFSAVSRHALHIRHHGRPGLITAGHAIGKWDRDSTAAAAQHHLNAEQRRQDQLDGHSMCLSAHAHLSTTDPHTHPHTPCCNAQASSICPQIVRLGQTGVAAML